MRFEKKIDENQDVQQTDIPILNDERTLSIRHTDP